MSDDRANIVFKGELLWEFDNKLTEDQVKRYEVEYDGTGHDLVKGQTTYFYSPPTLTGECEFLLDEIKYNEKIGNEEAVEWLKGEYADLLENIERIKNDIATATFMYANRLGYVEGNL